jgi:aspartate racemase
MGKQILVPGVIGMAVETNCVYYRQMYDAADRHLNEGHSLRSVMDTLDFAALVSSVRDRDDAGLSAAVAESARRVEAAGADFVVISSNTGHLAAEAVRAAVEIPLLDIRDVAVAELHRVRARRAGIISTTMTHQSGLYEGTLRNAGIKLIGPTPCDAATVDEVIFTELIQGTVSESGVGTIQRVAEGLLNQGAEAILLACTDLTIMASRLRPEAAVMDTTVLHARAAGLRATGADIAENVS